MKNLNVKDKSLSRMHNMYNISRMSMVNMSKRKQPQFGMSSQGHTVCTSMVSRIGTFVLSSRLYAHSNIGLLGNHRR